MQKKMGSEVETGIIQGFMGLVCPKVRFLSLLFRRLMTASVAAWVSFKATFRQFSETLSSSMTGMLLDLRAYRGTRRSTSHSSWSVEHSPETVTCESGYSFVKGSKPEMLWELCEGHPCSQ